MTDDNPPSATLVRTADGKHLASGYNAPVILEETGTLADRIKLRLLFCSEYATARGGRIERAKNTLRRVLPFDLDPAGAWVKQPDSDVVENLRENGATLRSGPFGLWYTLELPDETT